MKKEKKPTNLMDGLFSRTLQAMGRGTFNIFRYAYASRTDAHKEQGLLYSLLTGRITRSKGARFLTEAEQVKLLSRFNKGLMLDGKKKRLSLDDSCKHVLVVAQTGAGKTTKYILPNIMQLAERNNSIIVTDPSGEIFSQTSGYMQSKGYNVLKFDPADPTQSIYYNPLRFIFSYSSGRTEIDEIKLSLLAACLVEGTLSGAEDSFWRAGAEGLIEFFAGCLRDTPRECHTLYNVYRLIEAMTPGGELLNDFVTAYVNEQRLKDKWESITRNPSRTFQTQLATTLTALKPLANSNIAKMLSHNSIRFSDLRKEKTVLYLTFPVNEASYYTFILNIFYTQLFHELMSKIPSKDDLPVFVLYDEFGHSSIPNFDIICTNIRKYKVSLSLVLQSFSQLERQYGKDRAQTIIEGGVNSMLFYSGSNLETARKIEEMLGKVIIENYSSSQEGYKEETKRREHNLLNADEIRTLNDNQAFFITGNKRPALIDITPIYKNGKYKNKYKLGTAHIRKNQYNKFPLRCALDEV